MMDRGWRWWTEGGDDGQRVEMMDRGWRWWTEGGGGGQRVEVMDRGWRCVWLHYLS